MKLSSVWYFVLALVGPLAASAQTATYNFTGTTTGPGNGIYSSVGAGDTVSGTYTFYFYNDNPSQSTGTPGSSAQWELLNQGGTYYGTPAPNAYVFTVNATVDGITFSPPSTPPPSSYLTSSDVAGAGNTDFAGDVALYSDGSHWIESELLINSSAASAYTSEGLPLFVAGDTTGYFESNTGGAISYVGYNITSLVNPAAPIPSSMWLLLSGLGGLAGLGLLSHRRPI